MISIVESLDLHLKKGALHKDLGVSADKNIPKTKLKVKSTDSELERKRKQFAINAAKWRKK